MISVRSFGLVVGEPEPEQRQGYLGRLLVRILHRDLEVGAGPHGGEQLVGCRQGDEAAGIVASLDRLPFGRTVVDLDQDRLGEIEAERQQDRHHAGLGLGVEADRYSGERDQLLPGIALDNLLNGTAFERLAVSGAFHPPGGRRRFGGLGRERAGQHEERRDRDRHGRENAGRAAARTRGGGK
jgi:hypothetical protein